MDEKLESFLALCCGTCLFAFESEPQLRQHQKEQDRADERHDGEPWEFARLRVGQELIWEQENASAFEAVTITEIKRNADGDIWIRSRGDRHGDLWNELSRFVEATRAYNHG